MPYPVIPEYITVHLGAPDAPAENVTVTFPVSYTHLTLPTT